LDDLYSSWQVDRLWMVRAQVEHDRALTTDDLVATPLEETAGLGIVLPRLDLERILPSLRGPLRELAEDSRADALATEVHDDLHMCVGVVSLISLQKGPGDRLSSQACDEEGQLRPRVELVPEVLGTWRRQPQVGACCDPDHRSDVGV
jgi:hypothetical protein